MRKILISLLLATTVVTPAFAKPPKDKDDDRSAAVERSSDAPRSEARSSRSNRSEAREQRIQRSERRVESTSVERAPSRNVSRDRARFEQRLETTADRTPGVQREVNINRRGRPTLTPRQQSTDSVSNWRERERHDVTQRRIEERGESGWAGRRHQAAPVGASPDRPAPPPQTAQHRERRPEWRSSWRNDHRYDWRNHRRHHRSLFRLGVYFDPFGWNYRRYNIGWRLWPSYYSSNYWLNDPYMYRLPYAPWPYKWVRYYDDALLVDTTTGQVVDVMYQFFW